MGRRLGRSIDRLTGATGLVGACLIVPLLVVMVYEVVLRFVFDLPTFWAYEIAWMLTGAHFALGVGYVLREDQHVRVDFLYARFGARTRAAIDGLVQLFLLLPGVAWITWILADKAVTSFIVGEVSGESAWNPVVWPLNACICFGFIVFSLQILAEVMRNARVLLGRGPQDEPA